MREVTLSKNVEPAIRAGHPWVYADAIRRPARALAAGEVVAIRAGARAVAWGYADPESPIAVRVLSRRAPPAVDAAWVASRVERACAIRRAAPSLADTTAVRLVHGENDGLPGLVVDVYADVGVIRFDGAGAEALWRPHAEAIARACAAGGWPLARMWARFDTRTRHRTGRRDGEALLGDPPPDELEIREGPARFGVDVRRGQKTGLFLDQRANRRAIATLARGADVLNLFCYTGGFSVHAALAGARRVTSVDRSRPATRAAIDNLRRNGLAPDAHPVLDEDALAFLETAARDRRRWDLVVCDPPSFAPNRRSLDAARRTYQRLNALALSVVGSGGVLFTASCSSHIDAAAFADIVAGASVDAKRQLRVVGTSGADADHPCLPGFPEGHYLKAITAYVP